jgi:hypothetical protein
MQKSKIKPIYLIGLNGDCLGIYNGLKELSESLNLSFHTVSASLRRKTCLMGKYFVSVTAPLKTLRPVYLLTNKGEYIKLFKNIEEVSKEINGKLPTVKNALKKGTCLMGKYFLSYHFPVKLKIDNSWKSTKNKEK